MQELRVGSLFSGIGALDLGLHELLKCKTEWFVEQNEYCQQVLEKRFPGTPIYDDVTSITGYNLASIDILIGGFPCQDLSVAGQGAGIKEGTRSGLFFEMWRLAEVLQPRFVLFENVPAIMTRGIDTVTDIIVSSGWTVEWFHLAASDVGAWHKRERWWAIAHREQPLFNNYTQIGYNDNGWKSLQHDLFSSSSRIEKYPKSGMASGTSLYSRPHSPSLEGALPTPTQDSASGRKKMYKQGGMPLTVAVRYPTPTATDYKDGGSEHSIKTQVKRKGTGVRLGSYVPASENQLLPTPVRNDGHKLGSNTLSRYIKSGGRRYSADDHRGTGEPIEWLPGKLNPDWVEPLMGLPSGYTDLDQDIEPGLVSIQSWLDGSWETDIPRLTEKKKNRVARVKALGNSVVPQCARSAFSVLRRRYE